MKDNLVKKAIRRLFFPTGVERRIRIGPLRGFVFRVNETTQLSPWYSGVERAHQRAFKRILRPGDTVVDVGANWGLHSLYLSRLVGEGGLVISLEPFPTAYAELEWHTSANRCANVRALAVAASDKNGSSPFSVGSSASTGHLSDVSPGTSASSCLTVPTRTLDSILQSMEVVRLRLIKIDVEGAESKVLAGAEETVARFYPSFVIDLHTPEQDVTVARKLIEWGYGVSRLSAPPITRTDLGWPEPGGVWGSILASPPV